MYIVKLENLLNYFSFFYWYITLVDELIGIIAAHLVTFSEILMKFDETSLHPKFKREMKFAYNCNKLNQPWNHGFL